MSDGSWWTLCHIPRGTKCSRFREIPERDRDGKSILSYPNAAILHMQTTRKQNDR